MASELPLKTIENKDPSTPSSTFSAPYKATQKNADFNQIPTSPRRLCRLCSSQGNGWGCLRRPWNVRLHRRLRRHRCVQWSMAACRPVRRRWSLRVACWVPDALVPCLERHGSVLEARLFLQPLPVQIRANRLKLIQATLSETCSIAG